MRSAIFDGDDTLWETEHLYDVARKTARSVVEEAALPGDEWERLQRVIDVENVNVFGFSIERFPTSCAQAYEVLCAERALQDDRAIGSAVYGAAASVFNSPAPLVDGADEVLRELAADEWQLILLTKGALEVQGRRIADSGLAANFDAVRIVGTKDEETWERVVQELDVDPAESWSIGNSLSSDIVPAVNCGLSALWIPAHVWEHERRQSDVAVPERTWRLSLLRDVPTFLRAEGTLA